jgi:hypothetical protein
MKTPPATLATRINRRGTSSLFGILIFQKAKFSSKKPLMDQILLSMLRQFVKDEDELCRLNESSRKEFRTLRTNFTNIER